MTYDSSNRHARSEESALIKILRSYKYNAVARDVPFELSDDQFRGLTKENCHWCGIEPARVSYSSGRWDYEEADRRGFIPYIYNGVDRIDSIEGYTLDNCVACCRQCNWAKRELTEEEFISWLVRAANHIGG